MDMPMALGRAVGSYVPHNFRLLVASTLPAILGFGWGITKRTSHPVSSLAKKNNEWATYMQRTVFERQRRDNHVLQRITGAAGSFLLTL